MAGLEDRQQLARNYKPSPAKIGRKTAAPPAILAWTMTICGLAFNRYVLTKS
jgi:hypothetical protein